MADSCEMRKCEDCKLVLDDDARYCPKCGGALSGDAGDVSINVQVGALLTSANLHRIREEWNRAIADATEALKLDPKNGDIASLLGSIYEQRGMLEEAANWYQMALEMNPGSTADRARLQKVSAQMETPEAAHRRPINTWVIVAAGLVLVAIVVGLVVARVAGPPVENQATQRGDGNAGSSRTANPPINITTAPSTESSGKAARTANAESTAPVRTPAEVAVAQKLEDSESLREAKVKIDDVIADPRQNVITATFAAPAEGSLTRDAILRSSAAVADGVFSDRDDVDFVTVRCVIPPSQAGKAQIAFVGDIARVTWERMTDSPDTAELERAFTDQWWHPQIK